MSGFPRGLGPIICSLIAQFAELQAHATRISALADVNADALVACAYEMAMIRGTTIEHELSRIEQKVMAGEL
jgi:hypothetical protein